MKWTSRATQGAPKNMSVIGIYNDVPGYNQNAEFELRALHFNFWILPVVFGFSGLKRLIQHRIPYKFFADVGLRIRVNSGRLSRLDMRLPCYPSSGSQFVDLSTQILDETINDLVFGRKVLSRNGRIIYDRAGEHIEEVVHQVLGVEPVEVEGNTRHRLRLASEVNATNEESDVYLRFRYECLDVSEILISKGWAFAKRGFIFDLRANDLRETISLGDQNQSIKMCDLKELNAFLITPTNLVPMNVSPPLHYSRLLEPNAWEGYLSSCEKFGKKQKFSIHQWKNADVTHTRPFRGYMHVHKEFGWYVFVIYAFGLITPFILSAIYSIFQGEP